MATSRSIGRRSAADKEAKARFSELSPFWRNCKWLAVLAQFSAVVGMKPESPTDGDCEFLIEDLLVDSSRVSYLPICLKFVFEIIGTETKYVVF
jgi:hypothetical protein